MIISTCGTYDGHSVYKLSTGCYAISGTSISGSNGYHAYPVLQDEAGGWDLDDSRAYPVRAIPVEDNDGSIANWRIVPATALTTISMWDDMPVYRLHGSIYAITDDIGPDLPGIELVDDGYGCWEEGRRITAAPVLDDDVIVDYSVSYLPVWSIRYHTGAGDRVIIGTLDDAMQAADDGAAYTQQDISITDADGREAARRTWYGVPYDPDVDPSDDPICIGDGYYADWGC